MGYNSYDLWFSPGVPLAIKAINAFIYSKHEALRSMKKKIMHHASLKKLYLIEIGLYKDTNDHAPYDYCFHCFCCCCVVIGSCQETRYFRLLMERLNVFGNSVDGMLYS